MSKVILAALTDAGISTIPWNDPADEVESGSPPPALYIGVKVGKTVRFKVSPVLKRTV